QVSLGRHVALKVLPRQVLPSPRQRQRFEREARAAARLHHTNIVPVFGIGEEGGLHYYVMQYIQGLGLDEVLNELRRLRRGEVALGLGAEGRGPEGVAPGRIGGGGGAVDADVRRGDAGPRSRSAGGRGGGRGHGLRAPAGGLRERLGGGIDVIRVVAHAART